MKRIGTEYRLKSLLWSWVSVAHICNNSYLGGRDWEDRGSRPDKAKKSAISTNG
jgi:hypothetical protein